MGQDLLSQAKSKADSVDLVSSDEQRRLTAQYLVPTIHNWLYIIKLCRADLDKKMKIRAAQSTESNIYGVMNIKDYPKGFCQPIRDMIFNHLLKIPLFQNFQRQGLIFKVVYVTLHDSYFQNGIQLGDFFVDVAADTVHGGGEKVVCTPLSKLNYQNFDSHHKYCEVAEPYLNLRIYPNTLFPEIFPMLPFVAVSADGTIKLFKHQEVLLYKDIKNNFKLLQTFLEQSPFAQKEIPSTYVMQIQKAIMTGKMPVEIAALFRPSTIKQLQERLTINQKGLLNRHLDQLKAISDSITFSFNIKGIKPTETEIIALQKEGKIPVFRAV